MPRKREASATESVSSAKRRRASAVPSEDADSRENSVLFREIWRILRLDGWTSRAPPRRSLDNRFRYVLPGCDPSGVEGKDYFLGERALVDYYTQLDGTVVECNGDTVRVLMSRGASPSGGQVVQLGASVGKQVPAMMHETSGVSRSRCQSVGRAADADSRPAVRVNEAGGAATRSGSGPVRQASGVDEAGAADKRGGSGAARGGFNGEGTGPITGATARRTGSKGSAASVQGGNAVRGGAKSKAPTRSGGGRTGRDAADGKRPAANVDDDGAAPRRNATAGANAPSADRPIRRTVAAGKRRAIGVVFSDIDDSDASDYMYDSDGSDDGGVSADGDPVQGEFESRESISRRNIRERLYVGETNEGGGRVDDHSNHGAAVAAVVTAGGGGEIDSSASIGHAVAYVNSLVAFSPAREKWLMTKRLVPTFKPVGSAYILGRVCRRATDRRSVHYEIRWLDTMFQKESHMIDVGTVQRGIENYRGLTRSGSNPSWQCLTTVPENDDIPADAAIEDLVQGEDGLVEFSTDQEFPTSLKEVEAIKSMKFDPRIQMDAPVDLYSHSDGSTGTRVRPECAHLFAHSASSSFLAYIPLYFWRQVVNETNIYAFTKGVRLQPHVTLSELMKFIGILFFMGISDKGEYANYWGMQAEDAVLGNESSSGLEKVMTLRRFKLIRKCFCFRASSPPTQRDPAARIRPLLNLLKCTGGKYIDLGRDVALDECSVACRSRYGRHCIVFNKTKPTGKYHFRMYMLCCATSWISVNFRFHCNSDLADRLDGVVDDNEVLELRQEWADANVSAIRKIVLEVARPLYGSNRILNTDNYYTSVQLLQSLRLRGLYARGTVKVSSKHFPKHTILNKKTATRGDHRQGVSPEHRIIAASWCDGNIVQIISNADASTITDVHRLVGTNTQSYPAPTCVGQYNKYMQGVDRLDQYRARFSVSDGHSYKKWHKKLALALIDIARTNAYLTRRLVMDTSKQRDPHRAFIIKLSSELTSGKGMQAPGDNMMLYEGDVPSPVHNPPETIRIPRPDRSAQMNCTAVASLHILNDCGRKRRACVICRWENRWPTKKTDYCGKHNVCLCRGVYTYTPTAYMCPDTDLTCWEKFHRYYLPNELYSDKGNIRKLAALYKLKKRSSQEEE